MYVLEHQQIRSKSRIPPPKLFEYFEETIGFDSVGGRKYGIWFEIPRERFIHHLESLSDDDYQKLEEARGRYDTYMNPVMGIGSLYEVNYMTLVLIALIEFVMADKEFEKLDSYLLKRLKDDGLTSKNAIKGIVDEYHAEQGERRLINKFFNTYLSDYEIEILEDLRQYPEWMKCDSYKKFIDKILEYRNEFVHGLSKKTIWPFEARPEIDDNLKITGFQKTLSIKDLIRMVWIGIFRRFGFYLDHREN